MKQNLIDWYVRSGFKFWKIENSKGKIIAENTAKSKEDKSNADENASRLSIELDALERNPTADRYTVNAMAVFGHDWKVFPFVTYGQSQNNFGTGGGSAMDMAIMFGKMQSDLANQSLIYQMQRDKEREERERQEKETQGTGIIEMVKPFLPALISSVTPHLIKGAFELAGQSAVIRNFIEKLVQNPNVEQGITTAVSNYFTQNGNQQSTET